MYQPAFLNVTVNQVLYTSSWQPASTTTESGTLRHLEVHNNEAKTMTWPLYLLISQQHKEVVSLFPPSVWVPFFYPCKAGIKFRPEFTFIQKQTIFYGGKKTVIYMFFYLPDYKSEESFPISGIWHKSFIKIILQNFLGNMLSKYIFGLMVTFLF